jgi:hypothetical protein
MAFLVPLSPDRHSLTKHLLSQATQNPMSSSLANLVSRTKDDGANIASGPDPILLSLFSNRFMSVAEASKPSRSCMFIAR